MIAFAAVANVLKKELSDSRYRHSLAVARLAGELAKTHGWDVEDARMAGLVHDCAKEWKPKQLIYYARRRRLKIPDLKFILPSSPNLLHAYVSADVAKHNGWIHTAAQVSAVRAHTLGCVPMGNPESILFVADLAAYDRAFPGVRRIRAVARRDLHAGLREALALKMNHQLRKGKRIHPMPVAVWNSLWT